MTRYITGYDGSAPAQAALRFAMRLAGATGAEVIAANVYHRPERVYGKGASDGPVALIEADARADAERVLRDSGPDVVHCAVGGSSTPEGLHRLAEDQHADLIVVGATHRGAAGRVVIGSVADHLLHGAPCPVAVVPADTGDEPIARVGVAYDTREESRAALATAERLARRLGAELVVLAVHQPVLLPYAAPGVAAETVELDRAAQDEFRRTVERDVSATGADPGTEIRVLTAGVASHVLADAAKDGLDLLVAGSRGYGSVRGVLLGSVSRYLVDHAPCPVLVTPKGVGADGLAGTPTTTAAEA